MRLGRFIHPPMMRPLIGILRKGKYPSHVLCLQQPSAPSLASGSDRCQNISVPEIAGSCGELNSPPCQRMRTLSFPIWTMRSLQKVTLRRTLKATAFGLLKTQTPAFAFCSGLEGFRWDHLFFFLINNPKGSKTQHMWKSLWWAILTSRRICKGQLAISEIRATKTTLPPAPALGRGCRENAGLGWSAALASVIFASHSADPTGPDLRF